MVPDCAVPTPKIGTLIIVFCGCKLVLYTRDKLSGLCGKSDNSDLVLVGVGVLVLVGVTVCVGVIELVGVTVAVAVDV